VTSLLHSDLHVEVLVVDNGSTDDSLKMLEEYKKKNTKKHIEFTIIESKENLGFVKANNLGAKKAKAETLLLLNSDIEVLDNAIEKLF
jgi:GT2 family glycosyltransferase